MRTFLKSLFVWVVILSAGNLLLGIRPSLAEMVLVGVAGAAVLAVMDADR